MTKWEYTMQSYFEESWATSYQLEQWLNEMGALGWEVVAMVPGEIRAVFYFKRPVSE